MSEYFSQQRERHMALLQRYRRALNSGDLATLAAILREAEDDSTLESLLLAIHDYYHQLEQSAPTQTELSNAFQLVARLGANAGVEQSAPALSHQRFSPPATSADKEAPTNISTNQPPVLSQPGSQRPAPLPVSGTRRRGRAWLSTLAAVLVVALLFSGFLLVFNHQRNLTPNARPTTTSHTTPGTITATSLPASVHLLIELYLERSNNTLRVAALQTSGGEVAWSYTLAPRNVVGLGAAIYPGMYQLTVHDGVVYVAIAGHIYALQARTGTLLWQHDLHLEKPAGVNSTSSIAVDQGMLYLAYANDKGQSTLYALNTQSGNQVWTHAIGSSQTFAASNGMVYIEIDSVDLSKSGSVTALRGSDGTVLWTYPTTPLAMIVVNNVLYIQSAHQQVAADHGGNSQYHPLLALDATRGQKLWATTLVNDNPTTLVFSHNLLILYRMNFQPQSTMFCAYHSSDGSLAWCTSSPQGPWDENTSNSFATDNALFVSYAQGADSTQSQANPTAVVQKLNPQNGHAFWTRKFSGYATPSALVAFQGTLYVWLDRQILALNPANGHTLWQTPGNGTMLALAASF